MKRIRFVLTLSLLGVLSLTSCGNTPTANSYQVIKTFSKRMPAEFEPVEMVKICYPNNMTLEVYKTIA